MIEPAFQLNRHQDRRAVRDAIVELCAEKEWWLAALHVRITHLHMVVDADAAPERILQACKAYATRTLKGVHEVPRHKYWTRSGDIRRLHAGRALASAIHYVLDGQGTRMEVYAGDNRAQDPLFHRGLVGAVVEALICRNSSHPIPIGGLSKQDSDTNAFYRSKTYRFIISRDE